MRNDLLLAIWWGISLGGCMDPTPDHEECVDIETARCNVRAKCIGTKHFDKEYPDFDEETCIAYAEEHCRTRKIGGKEWKNDDVKECVKAINDLVCDPGPECDKARDCAALPPRDVDETESLPACDFIEAPSGEGTDRTDAVQGGSDTGDIDDTDDVIVEIPTDLASLDAGIELPQ